MPIPIPEARYFWPIFPFGECADCTLVTLLSAMFVSLCGKESASSLTPRPQRARGTPPSAQQHRPGLDADAEQAVRPLPQVLAVVEAGLPVELVGGEVQVP